jgi:hypothetical protein
MEKTIESYYYNRKTGVPMRKSAFVIFLNFVLRLIYKTVKTVTFVAKIVFLPTQKGGGPIKNR